MIGATIDTARAAPASAQRATATLWGASSAVDAGADAGAGAAMAPADATIAPAPAWSIAVEF